MLSGLENPVHLLILAGIVLLIFGPKRLPELGRSLGSGIRGFKESISGQEPNAPESVSGELVPTPGERPEQQARR